MKNFEALLEIAEATYEIMKTTPDPIRHILTEYAVVFALWPDNQESDGVGMLMFKSGSANADPATRPVAIFPCVDAEQATALMSRCRRMGYPVDSCELN
jgi:hypothetical protein